MNYRNLYDQLIYTASRLNTDDKFVERHHIVPRCLGGDNSDSNMVSLTPRQHQFAHKLLTKMYPENKKLIFAANMMYSNSKSLTRTGRSPNWLRKRVSEVRAGVWSDPKLRAKHSTAMKDAWDNPARKRANSIRMKTYWSNATGREANSAKLSAHWLRLKKLGSAQIGEASP